MFTLPQAFSGALRPYFAPDAFEAVERVLRSGKVDDWTDSQNFTAHAIAQVISLKTKAIFADYLGGRP